VNTRSRVAAWADCCLALAYAALLGVSPVARGAGVTLITHGFDGNVTDWVIPMGAKIPQYHTFPGSNSGSYQVSITRSGALDPSGGKICKIFGKVGLESICT
jgi:hypothetical protein